MNAELHMVAVVCDYCKAYDHVMCEKDEIPVICPECGAPALLVSDECAV